MKYKTILFSILGFAIVSLIACEKELERPVADFYISKNGKEISDSFKDFF